MLSKSLHPVGIPLRAPLFLCSSLIRSKESRMMSDNLIKSPLASFSETLKISDSALAISSLMLLSSSKPYSAIALIFF